MDSTFNLPLHFYYRQPRWILPYLVISHSGAILWVYTVTVPVWLKLCALIILSSSFLFYLKDHVSSRYLLNPVCLILNSEDEWTVVDEAGSREIELLPGSFVHPGLIILRFRDTDRRVHSFILDRNSADENTLRRLRVRLRFKKTATSH